MRSPCVEDDKVSAAYWGCIFPYFPPTSFNSSGTRAVHLLFRSEAETFAAKAEALGRSAARLTSAMLLPGAGPDGSVQLLGDACERQANETWNDPYKQSNWWGIPRFIPTRTGRSLLSTR